MATESESHHLVSNTNNLFMVPSKHKRPKGIHTSIFPELPHILCLTEHHIKKDEIDMICIEIYNVGVKFCRQVLKNGRVFIFIYISIKFMNINLHSSCKEQDIEICAVKLNLTNTDVVIISIYRSLSGNLLLKKNRLYFQPATQ